MYNKNHNFEITEEGLKLFNISSTCKYGVLHNVNKSLDFNTRRTYVILDFHSSVLGTTRAGC